MYRKKVISLLISGALFGPELAFAYSTVIGGQVINSTDEAGVFNKGWENENGFLVKDTTINVFVENSGDKANGILVNASRVENTNQTTTMVVNSTINSEGSGAYLVGGIASFDNTNIESQGVYGIVTKGGQLSLTNGTVVNATKNGFGFYFLRGYSDFDGSRGTYEDNDVLIDSSTVKTENNVAIVVGKDTLANITVSGNSTISSGNGRFLATLDGSTTNLNVSDSVLNGSTSAQDASTINYNLSNSSLNGAVISSKDSQVKVDLNNKSSLVGSAQNVKEIDVDGTSLWHMGASSDVGNLTNAGLIQLSDSDKTGSVLTVHNNYVGNGGTLVFNSELAGDDSPSDRLAIEGNSSGDTNVVVNNIGGKGAQTVEGVELIRVDGQSDGTFNQSGRIVAGAYDYSLVRGNTNSNNWYLTSQKQPDPPVNPPVEPPVEPPVNPPVEPPVNPPVEPPVNPPVEPPANKERIVRPEGGAYSANIAAALTLFESRLSDRQGTFYVDPLSGEKKYTTLWLNQVGGRTHANDKSGQLKTNNNRYSAMLGGDIGSGVGAAGSWRVGLLAGYGHGHNTTTSRVTGYRAKGNVRGYTTGVYGTWYAEGTDEHGLYVDTLVQYSWFKNKVKGDDIRREHYDSDGVSTSLETGYVIPVSQSERSGFYLQPLAQITWSGISADNHTEKNGTRVIGKTDNNVRSRLGMKAFAKGHSSQDQGAGREFKPFIETNWIHNTRNNSVSMDGVDVTQSGTRNIAEAKLGIEGDFNQQLRLTGTIGHQMGDHSWTDTSAAIGIKYSF
ncbi:autotransporter outer membrane beta-barrel domain-containing protein [Erwinia sp. S38]|uniref:autotransporter outer membrane beta-barrel domain-containing protein n=1 Tax=Erwinia sp. S38 TaxID=2769338 RepID=UPI00190AE195|nr:autotransporter outer membrane beta-barrel domain-containing protein [Erwinia sp. S38]MBK0004499.1 autotransporter outer membrane beta-barrel domain-containing protein [Erwinia sp. S38]